MVPKSHTLISQHIVCSLFKSAQIVLLLSAKYCREPENLFSIQLPTTTPEHYLAGSHHQWGNPCDNRLDAIVRCPVQAEGVTVWSCCSTQSKCPCTSSLMDADGLHWS